MRKALMLVCVLSLTLSVVFTPFSSFAVSIVGKDLITNGDNLDDIDKDVTYESQKEKILDNENLTVEAKNEALAKINFMEEKDNNPITIGNGGDITRAAMYGTYWLDVWPSKQQTAYYCGPATGVQTLNYFNRSMGWTQSSIASAIGTTQDGSNGDVLREFINEESGRYYVTYNPSSRENMEQITWNGMVEWDMPPILRVKCTTADNWPYTSNGHFLNISAQDTATRYYELTDPNIKRAVPSNTTGKHWLSTQGVYNGTIRHPRREFYW